jgi:hypothetical protein
MAGFGLGGWWAASRLKSSVGGKAILLAALVGILMYSEPKRFGVLGMVFLAEGLGGLSTFGDSLSGEIFFAVEVEGIS